jgi:hypothetical protein
MKEPRQSSYFRPGAEKENQRIHIAATVCVCLLLAMLGAVAWDYVAVHGKWLIWFIPACGLLVVLVWHKPWIALAVYLGLRR